MTMNTRKSQTTVIGSSPYDTLGEGGGGLTLLGIDVTVVKMGNSFLAYYALMRACGARAEINGISMVMIFVGTRVLTATNSIPYHR